MSVVSSSVISERDKRKQTTRWETIKTRNLRNWIFA